MNGAGKPAPEQAFLGVGWGFPFAVDRDRRVATAAYEEDVRQAILIILGTNRGERLMRPEFGAGLNDFVFEPVTATTTESLRVRVTEALIDWEPRITVEEVRVETPAALRNQLAIHIEYRIRATNTLHNLVYPFYVREGGTL